MNELDTLMTNLTEVFDFENQAHNTISRYKQDFILNPDHMARANYALPKLDWQSIKYGSEEIVRIPDNKRGLYAFVAQFPNEVFPPHGYVMYIGITGKNSNRSLRERYMEYIRERSIRRRPHIAIMIAKWHHILRFFYAPVDDDVSSEDLQEMEIQLNTSLMPPFAKQDLDAEVREMRKAFP